jgi:polyadenylation factor subunit 2
MAVAVPEPVPPVKDGLEPPPASTSASAAASTSLAGPSRTNRSADTWQPKRYLEPNHPDNEEVLEQAAYQAAVTRPPGDQRGNRKYKPRRTVDYMGGVQKWRMMGKIRGPGYAMPIHSNPSDIINVCAEMGKVVLTAS